ncbi:MAG: tetratricopeptide repeat protein [Planctomycetes bacterium]|nr:tetratricopeptide repeat protein [Planctomycetota bacterium]
MIRFPLALRPLPVASRDADAWFLPGADPARWLLEITGWGIDTETIALLPIPASARVRTAIGVLAVVRGGPGPQGAPRAIPYVRRGGRLYLPAGGELDPDVSPGELDQELACEILVLHPAAGLVGFEVRDFLRPGDLLAAPPERPAAWDLALPGLAPAPRLLSVEPEEPPTVEGVLAGGREDIGTRPPGAIPPAPGEPMPGMLRRAGRWLSRRLAGGRREPPSQDGELVSKRAGELRRLLSLFEEDPDEGLRHALPLVDHGNRGAGRPGSRLGPRDVDYDARRLAGGAPGDPWRVAAEELAALRSRYRQAANREIRLGRHRRAAYVLAELLGDFDGAASALAQGGHFREAAALYLDRLERPLEAARCLEKGGLLAEAAPLYEAHGDEEKAGDLYARLERAGDAERCWRLAAGKLAAVGDVLSAAGIVKTKLGLPDDALELLASTWPDSPQAGPCLVSRLAILGGLERHEEAAALVAQLASDPARHERAAVLVGALASMAGAYPEPRVRDRAADAARVVAGERLPQAGAPETEELVRAVARLAPGDRLLARDGARFAEARRSELPRPARTPAGRSLTLVGHFELPPHVEWRAARSAGMFFYAAGFAESGPVLARSSWGGFTQEVRWDLPGTSGFPILLDVAASPERPAILALAGGPRLDSRSFPACATFPVGSYAQTPGWLPEGTLAFRFDSSGLPWVVREGRGELVLDSHQPGGEILTTCTLPVIQEPRPVLLEPLFRPDGICIAVGTRLYRNAGAPWAHKLPQAPRTLAGFPSLSPCLAIGFQEGGMLVRFGRRGGRPRFDAFGQDLARPALAFIPGGALIAASAREGRVYDAGGTHVAVHATFEGSGSDPVAVLPAPRVGEFAVVAASGEVRIVR